MEKRQKTRLPLVLNSSRRILQKTFLRNRLRNESLKDCLEIDQHKRPEDKFWVSNIQAGWFSSTRNKAHKRSNLNFDNFSLSHVQTFIICISSIFIICISSITDTIYWRLCVSDSPGFAFKEIKKAPLIESRIFNPLEPQ